MKPTIQVSSSRDHVLAVSGGVLLTLMINYNSLLAAQTTPVFASWAAHGIGAATALALASLSSRASRAWRMTRSGAPRWFYLGGIPGAFTVVLAAITVNGSLSLSGTVAFALLGQIIFGLAVDRYGLFLLQKRELVAFDLVAAACVLVGSLLIVWGN
ncbi:DMT family transporter [Terrarubrum flagellatum]|uniref:DMT family transporter n=1 Tax=Terrirubrum flagellatum TaxID=2895980 RepID=UPI00314517B5